MSERAQVKSFAQALLPVADALAIQAQFGSGRPGRSARALAQAKESARQEGYDEGFRQGVAAGCDEGIRQVRDEFDEQIRGFGASLGEALDAIDRSWDEYLKNCELPLAQLAVSVAAKVLASEIESNPESVLPLVRRALSEVRHAKVARIRVNPFDSEVVRERSQELLACAPSLDRVDVVEDASIQGGCRIESDGGIIDSTIDNQIRLILSALREDKEAA
ncbi:MAG: hypothetical protein KJZ62_07560 [Fimbriimonadaceae bacterium]|nr:hypothetical protein [Fimbriimonadaceae bacterium]MCC6351978.1 hypothetical protein [Fimbriimonadaceae bacterium]MCL4284945.1 hypothetical protein [Fimbriimonadaceae bacterium]QOJ12342.1 MAG: hypothetical protein HRU74_09865 [Chthonomonadaceae bacterium]